VNLRLGSSALLAASTSYDRHEELLVAVHVPCALLDSVMLPDKDTPVQVWMGVGGVLFVCSEAAA
jgi:hypothetical protein